ncbi:hypothetical protein A9Q96_00230 [Rhodobacterales bacterium 52_120_T64]|nr:hypothetical protein A9Q96_00230 [Rhodobacterales bacterium 52_120_T64]
MTDDDWSMIITKIIPQNAEPIDDILEDFDVRRTSDGACILPDNGWYSGQKAFQDPSTVCIGVRVDGDNIDTSDLSMKLATMALEKEVVPIIFSRGDYAGMEKFGFRVEKISGKTEAERQLCEEQLKHFWNMSVVI